MPGARWRPFHLGGQSELLAEFILNSLAFTSPVPYQQDVGHDFLCALIAADGNLLRAGPFFTVQVKSNHDDIVYEKEHEVEWLRNQDNPFFICVANRKELNIELFSTWNLHNSYLYRETERIILQPGKPHEWPYPRDGSRELHYVPLGEPILAINAEDVMAEDKLESYRAILYDWVVLERRNIVGIHARTGAYWVESPNAYSTNERLDLNNMNVVFYWNAANIHACVVNLGRAGASLRATIRNLIGEEGEHNPDNEPKIQALESCLKAYLPGFDPMVQQVLQEYFVSDVD